ncbi:MAG: trmE [Rickettsiaceae bacterium]|jgi:tRNA modification GTPase|nr:trmE [Rickettsiaceae bacterium]
MDTIFAPITPLAKSAIIVLRISGNKASECLKFLGVTKKLEDRKSEFVALKDSKNGETIDHALVTFFKGPNSFTGEDVVEISLHGSIYIARKIIDLLSEIENVRMAEAGEFSKRAFLNNKIDLIQAEAIVDLIESETLAQHRQALLQLQGELGKIYENWRQELIKITANIEAFIDFPDEDLPQDIIDNLESRISNLISEIKTHLNDNQRGEKIRQGLSLAIIGAPNVGKSSLINYLAKSEVAIVSEIAGTTRDVIDVHLDIGGVAVIISDTAGIRETQDLIEKEGVKRALQKAKAADLKIVVTDVENQQNFLEELGELDENTIIAVNKIDLKKSVPEKINGFQPILISVKNKIGLEILLGEIEKKVQTLAFQNSSPPITRARYRQALNNIIDNLSQFCLQKNIEFAAEDLRLAIREIGKINGKVEVDDILDVIFAGFCIGK